MASTTAALPPKPNDDSRSELMFLGKECHHSACHLHDFLPFEVRSCYPSRLLANTIGQELPRTPVLELSQRKGRKTNSAVPSMPPILLPTPLPPLSTLVHRALTSRHGRPDSAAVPPVQPGRSYRQLARSQRVGGEAHPGWYLRGTARRRGEKEGGAEEKEGAGGGVLEEGVWEEPDCADEVRGAYAFLPDAHKGSFWIWRVAVSCGRVRMCRPAASSART